MLKRSAIVLAALLLTVPTLGHAQHKHSKTHATKHTSAVVANDAPPKVEIDFENDKLCAFLVDNSYYALGALIKNATNYVATLDG